MSFLSRPCVAFLVTVAAGCGNVSERAPRAYVTNQADGTLSVIDLHRLEVVQTIEVGEGPRALQIGPSGETLYIALAPADGDGDSLVALDFETRELIRRIGSGPGPTSFDTVMLTIVVGNEEANEVAIVDASGGSIRARVPVGDRPTSVTTAPDETVWVTCSRADRIDVIDTGYSEKIGTIPVGSQPHQLVFSHDGRRAYVTNEAGGSVSVIDVGAREVIETIALPDGARPIGLAIAQDDARVYVATGTGASVAVIDTAADEVVDVIAVPGGEPRMLELGGDGQVYVTSTGTNDVAVIDPVTGALVARIPVGASPSGIAIER